MNRVKKIFIFLLKFSGIVLLLLLILSLLFWWNVKIPDPKINEQITPASYQRKPIGPDAFQVNNCWLKKNKYGVWEMYLEGGACERGVIYGVLAKELIEKQEEIFVRQINQMIPGIIYRQFLKLFIAWFNRDIYKYIPEENLAEIYGISLSFSDKFDYVAPKYYRILNYHAAHDIGHALNDFQLAGCTSFAVNKEFSEDSSLLIARNFDFYAGEDFAKEKLLVFVNPDSGYKYVSYSWAGFTGVVSGMNEKGLTVTINASRSDLPYGAKEPISILAREILQYSKNISEAMEIAKKREIFVSEALLIGSAEDDNAVIIEKSPAKTGLFRPTENLLVCANHFQSETFLYDSLNIRNIQNSDSKYRFDRVNELLQSDFPINFNGAAAILRNKEGENGKEIGFGNPKAVNQLIAHHGVVFKPGERKMWISSPPYQLGEFACYDLNKIFDNERNYLIDSLTIAKDSFLFSDNYRKYELFRKTKEAINTFVISGKPFSLDHNSIEEFISNNPDSYITYTVLGDFFKKKGEFQKARDYYLQALQSELSSNSDLELIKQKISGCINNN